MADTLLAVDDDAGSAELVVRIAERCGFEAFATSDPRGFTQLCKQLNPSILSIDINMPNIDATGLLTLLAEDKFQGRIMIVSGQDTDTLKQVADFGESLGLHRPDVMQKPIDISRMRALLLSIAKATKPEGDIA
jgi:two-component system, chemotaxis family, chemotaxis protein CheY